MALLRLFQHQAFQLGFSHRVAVCTPVCDLFCKWLDFRRAHHHARDAYKLVYQVSVYLAQALLHSIVTYPDPDLLPDLLFIVRMNLTQDREHRLVKRRKVFVWLVRYLFCKCGIIRVEIDIVYYERLGAKRHHVVYPVKIFVVAVTVLERLQELFKVVCKRCRGLLLLSQTFSALLF